MSGKQNKREAKRTRDAARQAARRRERQRTMQTAVIVLITVAIGGVLIFLSLDDPDPTEVAADAATEAPSDPAVPGATPESGVTPCEPSAPPPEPEGKQTYEAPEQVLQAGTGYVAVVDTTCGTMRFKMLEDDGPEAVNSFVFLAQQGFFDGLSIFRNEPSISILQTGSGDNTNMWDIGYELPDELGRAQELGYTAGSLAMANAGPGTAGSQFFMVYDDSELAADYTLFGQLVEGLDVLQSIGAIPNAEGDVPSTPASITSVTIESFPEEPPGPLAPVETTAPAPVETTGSDPLEPAVPAPEETAAPAPSG